MRKRLFQLLHVDDFVGDRLLLHLHLIGVEWYRRRTDILTASECFACSLLASAGESVAHDILALLGWAANFDERLFLCEIQQRFDNALAST